MPNPQRNVKEGGRRLIYNCLTKIGIIHLMLRGFFCTLGLELIGRASRLLCLFGLFVFVCDSGHNFLH